MADLIPSQLPLALRLRPDAQLSSLYVEPNEWFVDWLKAEWAEQREYFCWLDAAPGSGLTHVLQAIAQQSEQLGQSVFYVSFAQHDQLAPALLAELPTFDALCLDDVDCILGQPDWDLALLHCFNEMFAQQKQLVIGGHLPLSEVRVRTLPDLWSRLNYGMTMRWRRPVHWESVIDHVAQTKGLSLDAATLHYMASRMPRSWPQIMSLMAQIDQAALIAKRRVTIPFIRQVLDWSYPAP